MKAPGDLPRPWGFSFVGCLHRILRRNRGGKVCAIGHQASRFDIPREPSRDGLKEQLADSKPAEIKAKCIETLRKAGAVVDAKAPGDAAAFKSWLRQISQHVAEAAKEGGFLGIGGAAVSEAEKATLAEISSALKLAA